MTHVIHEAERLLLISAMVLCVPASMLLTWAIGEWAKRAKDMPAAPEQRVVVSREFVNLVKRYQHTPELLAEKMMPAQGPPREWIPSQWKVVMFQRAPLPAEVEMEFMRAKGRER